MPEGGSAQPLFQGRTSKARRPDAAIIRRASVFEGFMDYLSFLTLKRNPNPPHQYRRAELGNEPCQSRSVHRVARTVYTYLDTNEAGAKGDGRSLKAACRNLSDQSVHYRPHNDLNDYLRSCRPVKEHRRSCGRKL